MHIYRPTWLYIKQHNVTGLKYFGKTACEDPVKYKGSGLHWQRHIKKHGNDVTTTLCQLFNDRGLLTAYATAFSDQHNIVESDEWANLKSENGLDGGFDKLSPEIIQKGVDSRKSKNSYVRKPESIKKQIDTVLKNGSNIRSQESIQKQLDTKKANGITNIGRKHSESELIKMRESHLGSRNKSSKLIEEQIIQIKQCKNLTVKEIASLYNVSCSTIYKIKDGSNWGHILA